MLTLSNSLPWLRRIDGAWTVCTSPSRLELSGPRVRGRTSYGPVRVIARKHHQAGNLRPRAGVYEHMSEAMIRHAGLQGDSSRAQADDFGAYVRASERRHKRLAFLLTGDLHEAEDLLQAAYAKVYPNWSKVRTYDIPDAYLRRVMVSLRTSWWRRSRNREWSVPDRSQNANHIADPAGTVIQTQALLLALRQLPERQRAAVVLRHWCDLSEAETAAAMRCSLGTVKSNTSKGLAHLRAALGRTEEGAS